MKIIEHSYTQSRINHVAEVAFATGPALFKIMIQITEKIRLHFCKKVSARTRRVAWIWI